MTNKNSRSLTLAADPIARLKEMHELDQGPSPSPNEPQPYPDAVTADNAVAQQQSNAATLQRSSEIAQERDSAAAEQQSNAEAKIRTNAAARKRRSEAAPFPYNQEPASQHDPVRDAMRQALRQPYLQDFSNAPSTSTTIRIPSEIWERLDMASKLQGSSKQEIIAQALKKHLTKIGRGEE